MSENKESEKKVSYKERLIMSDKAGYKVPAFLLGRFDNDPSDSDFITLHGEYDSEIPMWWKRDISLPVSKSEFRKDTKRAITSKRALDLQCKRLDESLASYVKALAEQEKIFEKRCEQLRTLEEGKTGEIEEQFKLNDRNYQLRLMEFEALIQKEYQENELLRQKTESMIARDKLRESFSSEEEAVIDKLEKLEDEYKSLSEGNRIIREKLVKLYKEAEQETEETSLLSEDEIINSELPIEKEEETKPAAEPTPVEMEELIPDKDYYPYKKVFSAYDSNNIIEVRSLSVLNRSEQKEVLKNIFFSVPRKGVTIVYSNKELVLELLYGVIIRNLGSDLHITKGEVRIDGEQSSQLLKGEFSVKMRAISTNFTEVEDKLARSQKNYKTTFKGYDIDFRILFEYLGLFGVDVKLLNEKQNRLEEAIRERISFATILSARTPLSMMFMPSSIIKGEDKEKLTSLLNSVKEKAILVFTSDSSFAAEIKNSSLYTF